ncbi:MAG: riboflavin synthase [Candidatus Cloacimonadaceae bacterium]|jgi:riboflavin synthase|nr:riboflavin synthase [Candidatus Syntrophosphaera sp.]NLN85608.1 riboflavin synthase [Candidatus Cloacimonadota bacterium]
MFTGIILATSRVLRVVPSAGAKMLSIQRPKVLGELKIGASIACDGICLTLTGFSESSFEAEIMAETLAKTTAGSWNTNSIVNLEPALKIGDSLDGHWVQGHIDRVSTLLESKTRGATTWLRFELDSRDRALMVPQGSVAVNGVSLTISELKPASFTIALISHTRQNTNLGQLSPGAKVNLEYDVLGKYARALHETGSLKLEDYDE